MVALGGGGMHGCSGGCVVALGGRAWLLPGACMVALGGHVRLLWGACMVAPGGHVWWLLGGHGCSGGAYVVAPGGRAWLLPGGHAWDMTRYGDTINERVVRILLECIVLSKIKANNSTCLSKTQVVRSVWQAGTSDEKLFEACQVVINSNKLY